jgi:hypothetical protein
MKARWPKYLMHLRVIAQIIEDNGIEPKSFLYLDEAKVKQLRRLLADYTSPLRTPPKLILTR